MNPIWMLARGSGVAAYLLLAGATIWGLLLASKVLDRSASARDLTWVHESLSLAAVAATVVHMVSLWLEEFIDFDLRHLLIPGASSFRPVPVALGVVAFWALAVITPSFYLRNRIGQRAWRTLHFATFGCFLAAAIHGITAGTDTGRAGHGGPLRHHPDRGPRPHRPPADQGRAVIVPKGRGEQPSTVPFQTAHPAGAPRTAAGRRQPRWDRIGRQRGRAVESQAQTAHPARAPRQVPRPVRCQTGEETPGA